MFGKARWQDGYWDVTLKRAMDTGKPADDKVMADKRVYNVAFAVHRNTSAAAGTTSRYRSRLGSAATPTSSRRGLREASRTGIGPGIRSSCSILARSVGRTSTARNMPAPKASRKVYQSNTVTAEVQLAHYGIEAEFADAIRRQWLFTMAAGILLIAGFGIALNLLLARKQGV